MTPEVLSSYAQIQELRVAEVVNYLQQNHWMAISHPSPRFLVFEKGVDDQGKPIQIVLPSKDDYEDTPYLEPIRKPQIYEKLIRRHFWRLRVHELHRNRPPVLVSR